MLWGTPTHNIYVLHPQYIVRVYILWVNIVGDFSFTDAGIPCQREDDEKNICVRITHGSQTGIVALSCITKQGVNICNNNIKKKLHKGRKICSKCHKLYVIGMLVIRMLVVEPI